MSRQAVERIFEAFITLLQDRELKEVYVTDVCKLAGINRSTFYANFTDIYALADQLCRQWEQEFAPLFETEDFVAGLLRTFEYIQQNQRIIKTYFKLIYDERHQPAIFRIPYSDKYFNGEELKYHLEFFRSGINAVIRIWLQDGCKETPQQMTEMICREYRARI